MARRFLVCTGKRGGWLLRNGGHFRNGVHFWHRRDLVDWRRVAGQRGFHKTQHNFSVFLRWKWRFCGSLLMDAESLMMRRMLLLMMRAGNNCVSDG